MSLSSPAAKVPETAEVPGTQTARQRPHESYVGRCPICNTMYAMCSIPEPGKDPAAESSSLAELIYAGMLISREPKASAVAEFTSTYAARCEHLKSFQVPRSLSLDYGPDGGDDGDDGSTGENIQELRERLSTLTSEHEAAQKRAITPEDILIIDSVVRGDGVYNLTDLGRAARKWDTLN